MAPDALTRIFEPFFTSSAADAGTGVGLFISRQPVADHGGSIEVESQPLRGTAFRVFLPAGPLPTARPARDPSSPPDGPANGGRVLVVDDEPAIGGAIRAALRAEHEVVVVERAADAFALLAAGEPFDLVLCDLIMPDIAGPDVYTTIAERWPSLVDRLIFMTGGAFTAATSEFVERGVAPIIIKPFRLDELRRLVRERMATQQGNGSAG